MIRVCRARLSSFEGTGKKGLDGRHGSVKDGKSDMERNGILTAQDGEIFDAEPAMLRL